MKKIYYKINGVDCANCGLKIQDNVHKLEGVYFSGYTYMTERLDVLFDENIITEDKIEDVIVNTISGVKIARKTEIEVTMEDIKLTQKKNDKVKMIFFRRKK